MDAPKNVTALEIDRSRQPDDGVMDRIADPRDEIVRRLETAWQRALDKLFAERRAA